jgi:tetratricopeptide (TPR) repeat protein
MHPPLKSHPFGDLITQFRSRKHGLSQNWLARCVNQDPAVISAMCRGERLTGPRARERVLAIIACLQDAGVLATRAEADALLHAAGLAGLRERAPDANERQLAAVLVPSNGHGSVPPAPQLLSCVGSFVVNGGTTGRLDLRDGNAFHAGLIAADNLRLAALTLSNLGDACIALGEMQRALDYYEQALCLSQQAMGRDARGWHGYNPLLGKLTLRVTLIRRLLD